jgi:hypothetical protein
MVLYILTFTFLDSRRDDKRLWTERYQALLEFSLLLISSFKQFWFVSAVLNIWTSSKNLFAVLMLCLCPIICLVFSGFTSRPTSLLASNAAFLFFCLVSIFLPQY